MGKFDRILIATDLDGTILTDDKKISEDDKNALQYFMAEGGRFTFCSGRSIHGVQSIIAQFAPNAPVITYNGAMVYDTKSEKIIWESYLDEASEEVVNFIEESFPFSGIEICTEHGFAVSRTNFRTEEQLKYEGITPERVHQSRIPHPWRKVLFIQEADEIGMISDAIAASPYSDSYNFMQSAAYYYEMLPKDASKGLALLKVAKMLGITKTIGVGDNDNDLSLVKLADIGIGVKNASPSIINAADYITVDNNSSPMADIIKAIEDRKLKSFI